MRVKKILWHYFTIIHSVDAEENKVSLKIRLKKTKDEKWITLDDNMPKGKFENYEEN